MAATFRASMAWLHTWAGLVLGGVLFAIFWTGTLSVFDQEIDRWMIPATRLEPAAKPVPLDALADFYQAAVADGAPNWRVFLPYGRDPVLRLSWRSASGNVEFALRPDTGERLPHPETLAATGFLFPFHYSLHIGVGRLGYWIVAAATMGMLALCVSGVVIHRRLFVDFFVFRPDAAPARSIRDLHTVSGILGLPFNVVIAISGLVLFWPICFPGSLNLAYENGRLGFNRDAFGLYDRVKAGRPGSLASLDAMARHARDLWDGGSLRLLSVQHPGDAAAHVMMMRRDEGSITASTDRVYFDASTGLLLHRGGRVGPVVSIERFLAGLHEIQFRHWPMRWLYFGMGLTGCVLMATGCMFWVQSRRRRHVALGLAGARLMNGLAAGSVTGMLLASLAFFVANRVLPPGAQFLGQERAALEVWSFYLTWLAGFSHGWWRSDSAWREQCWSIAGLALAAAVLNAVTTKDHLLHSLTQPHLWGVAGMDIMLLGGSAIAVLAATALRPEKMA